MSQLGSQLRLRLQEQATKHGLMDFCQTGPPSMPFFDFASERGKPLLQRARIRLFCSECAKHGIWFHPYHTMFLTGSHTPEDIEQTLRVTDRAFEKVASMQALHPVAPKL
eukprot:m.348328 g.348328  ORF g.348328 m.348328 type:complete len:110 (+) comp20672_c1_seq54:2450-2779(+)